MIAEYAREVLEVHPRGRLLVGVDGIEHPADAPTPSAREAFAQDLAGAFTEVGVPARAVATAPYLLPDPSGPGTTPTSPERFTDVGRLRSEVVAPFRAGAPMPVGAAPSPAQPDGGWTIDLSETGDRAVLVVHGAFLHVGDLAGMWHTSAWVQLHRSEALRRDAERLGVEQDGEVLEAWATTVDLAFRRLDARKLANATFDLTDPEHPRREFEDAC